MIRRVSAGLLAMVVVGAVLATGPEAAFRKPIRIGALTDSWGPTPQILGLRDGLLALGHRENIDFVLGVRFTQGDADALPAGARELAGRGVDIIFGTGVNSARAALQATEGIPIVFAGGGDPLRAGIIQSFARPGGRVTGVTDLDFELGPKRLEMLNSIVPGLKRVLFIYNAGEDYAASEIVLYREAARRLGIALVERPVRTQNEAQAAVAQVRRNEGDGILVPRFLSLNIPGFALEATQRRGIPAIFTGAFWVERGALVSYGPSYYASGRQAARLLDKVVKGENPAGIPVETNASIHLAVNVRVARQLGLTIPRELLSRADQIVE